MEGEESKSEIPEYMRDAMELKAVLDTISSFLSSLAPMIREILDTIFEQFSGERIGKDVATLYKNLKEAGIDDEAAKEMAVKYFEERASLMRLLREILSSLSSKGMKEHGESEVA